MGKSADIGKVFEGLRLVDIRAHGPLRTSLRLWFVGSEATQFARLDVLTAFWRVSRSGEMQSAKKVCSEIYQPQFREDFEYVDWILHQTVKRAACEGAWKTISVVFENGAELEVLIMKRSISIPAYRIVTPEWCSVSALDETGIACSCKMLSPEQRARLVEVVGEMQQRIR
jgi:hypothetical protein